MRRSTRNLITALFPLLLIGTHSAVHAQTLNGETLISSLQKATVNLTQCDPDGVAGTMSFDGTAAGPIAGTFVEEMTFKLTAAGGDLSAVFTILGPKGETLSKGTKSGSATGACVKTSEGFKISITSGVLSYTADVGGVQDSGTSLLQLSFARDASGDAGQFSETFASASAAVLKLEPITAINPVATTHTVTATVMSADGRPVDTVVYFTVKGSVAGSGKCTTEKTGQCSFTYSGPTFPGADSIHAFADLNLNNIEDAGEPSADATKAWVAPSSSVGHVTGGGQAGGVTFGFEAKVTADRSQGRCTVVDQRSDVLVKCIDVTGLSVGGSHATIFGNATINGLPTTYRIDVDDLGESGAGQDSFTIQTGNGYTAGGILDRGNVQIHKEP